MAVSGLVKSIYTVLESNFCLLATKLNGIPRYSHSVVLQGNVVFEHYNIADYTQLEYTYNTIVLQHRKLFLTDIKLNMF